ncbi:magnesium-translocating P-type ATPase [Gemmatimonas sp.]|uniref:magnesium-translocating P-type ATPase n=1 Tax=Gemmatimonas sp. TaxID=1962908 RepID=UPI0025C31F90|nr:magnesium-translocating P-type ATPase [Gemmatimonas sp.]MCA2989547.1 magnesium-translocating P-type ATPase [Gemmatimonas sp.]
MPGRWTFRRRRTTLPALAQSSRERIAVSPLLASVAGVSADEVFSRLETTAKGLNESQAAQRLVKYGANEMLAAQAEGWVGRLWRAVRNPLVLLLASLGVVSAATGDIRAATVIGVMIVAGVSLRFVQEARADAAAAALRKLVHVTTLVTRDGSARELPVREVVPGDLITLSAGDMLPADVRLITAKDLFVGQSSLTGESLPVEKSGIPPTTAVPPLESPTLCFRGTSVQSGTATAVVVATGAATYFGQMVGSLEVAEPPSSFQKGIDGFTWLMIRLILVMAPLVFLINGFVKHDWKEAFFFALAVAVGLTPEMLPMIFSVCLSKGAVAMSRRKVIIKHLDAIQSLGAIDVLCTDKTGTLTVDSIILERHCDVRGAESASVLADAYLVSHFQTGLKSALDEAILAHQLEHEVVTGPAWTKVDEVPFDFTRRLMSVVVEAPDRPRRLVAKGAAEETIGRCVAMALDGNVVPIDASLAPLLRAQYESMSRDGFRVLAVASRDVPVQPAYGVHDETGLVLAGFLGFLDPPKESAAPAIAALRAEGVRIVILTGDNELITQRICSQVSVDTTGMLLGAAIEVMDDDALAEAVDGPVVFARLTPGHKQRIIRGLQQRGHIVGFLGDGINDAPALHTADVGLSVDSAVDIAKDSADVILLEKNLLVITDAVREGRAVFANILKYIRMGASSNFGNMFSVIGASALLPFLPMAPIQILANNLLYDFSQLLIPTDKVDADQLARPHPWSIAALWRYLVCFGPMSSIFDYTTFAILYFVLEANTPARAGLFQTGWFVESLLTQTLIIHVIRTNRLPFLQSMPSWPLLATTAAVIGVGMWLPFSPFAAALGFVALPAEFWPWLLGTVLSYLLLTQLVKMWLVRRGWL